MRPLFESIEGLLRKGNSWLEGPSLGRGNLEHKPLPLRSQPSRNGLRDGKPPEVTMLVLDNSASMDEWDFYPSRLAGAKNAATKFLLAACSTDADQHVGIVTFSTEAKLVAAPTEVGNSVNDLTRALERIKTGNSTNIEAGLDLAREQMQEVMCLKKKIILLTDGAPTDGDSEAAAQRAKDAGIVVKIIGIGGHPRDVDELLLKRMASVVNGQLQYWFIADSPNLVKRFESLGLRAF